MDDRKKTYKEKNGTTRVGDALRWLVSQGKEVAPELLEIASDITGIDALDRLGGKISGSKELTEMDKKMLLEQIELDKIETQEITKRWQADMQSDSFASKNIRPYTVGYLLIVTTILIILDSAFEGFEVKNHWVELLGTLTVTAVGGYFVLRETGKAINNTGLKAKLKNAFKK